MVVDTKNQTLAQKYEAQTVSNHSASVSPLQTQELIFQLEGVPTSLDDLL